MRQHPEQLKESLIALEPVRYEVVDHFIDSILTQDSFHFTESQGYNRESFKIQVLKAFEWIIHNEEQSQEFDLFFSELGFAHAKWIQECNHLAWIDTALDTLSYFFADTWTHELSESWNHLFLSVFTQLKEGANRVESLHPTAHVHTIHKPTDLSKIQTEDHMKEDIQNILREMIRETLHELIQEDEVKSWIREDTKSLLKEMMYQEIQQLREKWKNKQAA